MPSNISPTTPATSQLSSAQLRTLLAQTEAREAAQKVAASSSDSMDVDAEAEDVDIDGEGEDEIPKTKKKAKGKEVEVEPKTRRSTRKAGKETEDVARSNVLPVRKLIPYIELDSDDKTQPGSHIYRQKCSGCQSRNVVCWAQYEGKACTTCSGANRRCDHSSMGPAAAKKKKDSEMVAPVVPDQNVYSPTSGRPIGYRNPLTATPSSPQIPITPLNARPPIAPRPTQRVQAIPLTSPSPPSQQPAGMAMVRSPRQSPAHHRTQSSPGRNVEVFPVSVDGVAQEIREWRISADRNMEALEDNTRELRGHWNDMREMMDMVRLNADAVRENMSELRRTRLEQERRTDYGDRSRGSYYGGSQGGFGSQGGRGV